MKNYFWLFIIVFGCAENDVIISDELTIEGVIEQGKFANINLTNSIPISGVIDSLEVALSIESKAKVVLSDGDITEILTLKRDNSSFPFLYYQSNIIKGEVGKAYSLSVQIRNKEFLSHTNIPEETNVLNLEFSDWIEDGVVYEDYKDIKLTIENKKAEDISYYKILIKNENEDKFQPARPFILSTENISVDSFPLLISYIKFDDDGAKNNQLKVGEVFELKLVAITKEQFEFWKSIEGDATSILDNSSFTLDVKSNISNGAFGYWSGENVESFKFKIP